VLRSSLASLLAADPALEEYQKGIGLAHTYITVFELIVAFFVDYLRAKGRLPLTINWKS